MVTKAKERGIYPIYAGLKDLDSIVAQLPEKYGAKVDHRIKRDTWIWVKPEYQEEAWNYLKNELNIPCVLINTSDKWYYGY